MHIITAEMHRIKFGSQCLGPHKFECPRMILSYFSTFKNQHYVHETSRISPEQRGYLSALNTCSNIEMIY